MKLRRVNSLVKKDIKSMTREPASLFLIILFPVVLTLVFGVSFGAIGGGQSTTYQIGVVDLNSAGSYPKWGQYFIGNLSQVEILRIQTYLSNDSGQSDLVQGRISAVVIIPHNFGQSCHSYWASPMNSSLWTNTTVELYLDSGSMFATQAIPPIIQQALIKTLYGIQPSTTSSPIQVGLPSFIQTSTLTTFDYFVPGLFAFAAIFLIMTVSESLMFEREKKLLRRINTTPTTASEFMASKTLSHMIFAIIQMVLVFVSALLVGYSPVSATEGFVLAFIVMAIFSLCCVGFGLIAAAAAKSSGAATGLSFIFILPLMMLGTYVSVGLSGAAQVASRFVPSWYATDALTSLLLRGAPISSPAIFLDIAVLSIYSVVVLAIGILLFRKYGKS